MLETEVTIARFVAAVMVAALLSGCTFNVYITDQVIYGTVTQETKVANEKFSAAANHPHADQSYER